MRLALVGSPSPGSLAWSLAAGARELGHDAVLVPADALVAGRRPLILGRQYAFESLVARPLVRTLRRRLERLEPELTIIVKGRFLTSDVIDQLRRALRAPLVNYYPDHPLWPGFHEPKIVDALHAYDEVIVWAEYVAKALRDTGLRQVRVVPFGYDPSIYKPAVSPVPKRWDVALIGQWYPVRMRFIEPLVACNLLVSGRGWRRAAVGTPLATVARDDVFTGPEVCERYWSSEVALNILHEVNVPAHNMRTFEIPASGTAMVATRTPEHEALFSDEGAVLVSEPQEAREVVIRLLRDSEWRRRTAEEGLRRVRPHTYAARMQSLLEPWLRR